MTIRIGKDGTIHLTATTRLPLLPNRPKVTNIGTKMELTKKGLQVTATMPGIIARNQQMITTVELSIDDLVKVIRHKLKNAGPTGGEKFRAALLAIKPKNMAIGALAGERVQADPHPGSA